MIKPVRVVLIYFGSLLAFSLFFSAMGLSNAVVPILSAKVLLTPMLFITIAGGIFCLFLTLPKKAFIVFVAIYTGLWCLRILFLYLGNRIGQFQVGNKIINVDFVIANYYKYVSRIDSPLPFVLFWFVHYLFSLIYPAGTNSKAEQSDD